jgi:hypothetical protein
MAAFDDEETSDSILFWNDDHFLMDGLDVKDFRYWYDGTIDEWGQKAIGNYKRAIQNTAEIKGLNRFYTDIHTPIIYQRAKFKALAEMDWSKEYVIKTAYTMRQVGNFEPLDDIKVNKPLTYKEWQERANGRKFLSIGPYGVSPGLIQLLTEHFPNCSKYENSHNVSRH